MTTQEGPLSRLNRALGIDAKLAPIAAMKRIEETPLKVGTPVSASTPTDRVCPTCRNFETEEGTPMCPRCNRRAEIRGAKLRARQEHLDSVRREVLALRLDKIDPDWPQKFTSTEQAARHYREQLAAMEPPL